jgi:hypothetical protein
LAAAVVSLVLDARAADPKQTQERGAAFVGAVGCRSSSCHGGAGPKRSQYITWSRQDFHAKAFAVLTNARSARIAETLGPTPAQENARCTVCHSPFGSVAQTRLTATAHPDEGVSCESCHGASGTWLRGHTRRDWTYSTRVAAGMRDMRSLYVRANTCVACHQNVEPELLRAGHPELTFELDSQSVNEPPHWQDTDPAVGPRSWLTGQAVALREMSWAMSRDGHNDSELPRWQAVVWLLAKASAADPAIGTIGEAPPNPSGADFVTAQRSADEIARRAAQWSVNDAGAMSLLRAFAATDSEFSNAGQVSPNALGRRAERLVLAIERLSSAAEKSRAASSPVADQIKKLTEDVRPLTNFDAGRFAGHLRDLRVVLENRS